jgi:O-antigen ligase/polysaccharide polymerase Wzy-like membrane protein
MILLGVAAAFLLFAPALGALRGAALVSLVSLVGLAVWTLISGLWSPVPAVAFSDSQRVVAYIAAFVIGAWSCLLLGRRLLLSLSPLAVAGSVVALISLIVLWTGTNSRDFFETDATLRYPIGYRNAEAAFFLMALLPAIVLCASRELPWQVRGVLLGFSTLMIELAILAQSRASMFGAIIAVAVLIGVHPERLRVFGWLTLAAIPALIVLPWLLDPFQLDAGRSAAEIPPLHRACVAMAITSTLSLAVGMLGARFGSGYELPDRVRWGVGRALLGAVALVILVGLVALFRSDGGPAGFVDQRVGQLTAGTPDLASQGSRFGLNVSSDRGEFWRVALDDFDRHPLDGDGAGGFRASYLLHGEMGVQPEDPHSIEMLMLSELGIPGALLMLAFVGGGAVAIVRSRRLGREEAILAAAALSVGSYWFAHASVDWFWSYAAITLPAPFLIGAAAAPALRRAAASEPADRGGRTPLRMGLAVAAIVLALTMVPFFFAEGDTDHAIRTWRTDLSGAYRDLDNAADLNPWSSRALEAKADIAIATGNREVALSATDQAIKRTPDDWIPYFQRAQAQRMADPADAARAIARARQLSPHDPQLVALAKKVGVGH